MPLFSLVRRKSRSKIQPEDNGMAVSNIPEMGLTQKILRVCVSILKIHFIRKFDHSALMTNTDKPLAIIKSHLFSKGNKLFTGIVTVLMQGGPS